MKRFCLCAVFLAFCSAKAALPLLVPREILFANPARTDPKISPDGSQLSWLAPDKSNTLNVWTSALDGTNAHCVTNETGDPIEWYTWAGDSKHVLYLHDNFGDEIPHLFSADLASGNARDLTPFRGVRAQNVLTNSRHPDSVLVAMNLRDRTKFDMYPSISKRARSNLKPKISATSLHGGPITISLFAPPPPSMGRAVAQSFGCVMRLTNRGATLSSCLLNGRSLPARSSTGRSLSASLPMAKAC